MLATSTKQKVRYSHYNQSLPHHQEELLLPILNPFKISLQCKLSLEQVYQITAILTGLTVIYTTLIMK